MTDEFADHLPALRPLLRRLAASGHGEILRDERAADRALHEALVRSGDPAAREIGEQLRDGKITAGQLATGTPYRDLLERGTRNLALLDPARLAAALGPEPAAAPDGEPSHPGTTRRVPPR